MKSEVKSCWHTLVFSLTFFCTLGAQTKNKMEETAAIACEVSGQIPGLVFQV